MLVIVVVADFAFSVRYARKHLTSSSAGDLQLKEVQTAMGLLAFTPDTKCRRYQVWGHKVKGIKRGQGIKGDMVRCIRFRGIK